MRSYLVPCSCFWMLKGADQVPRQRRSSKKPSPSRKPELPFPAHGLDLPVAADSSFCHGLLVLELKEPAPYSFVNRILGVLSDASMTSMQPMDYSDDEAWETERFRFLPVPLHVPSRKHGKRLTEALLGVHEIRALARVFGFVETTCADCTEKHTGKTTRWRNGPPRRVESVSFPLHGFPEILDGIDLDDFGVFFRMAEPMEPDAWVLVSALFCFWWDTYTDLLMLQNDASRLPDVGSEEEPDPKCFRQGDASVGEDRQVVHWWVDRFVHPGTAREVVGHLMWVLEGLHSIIPIQEARFGGADYQEKYGIGLTPLDRKQVVMPGESSAVMRLIATRRYDEVVPQLARIPDKEKAAALILSCIEHLDEEDEESARLAIEMLEHAMEKGARRWEIVQPLIRFCFASGEVRKALCLAREHGDVPALVQIMEVLISLGKLSQATRLLAAVIQRDQKHPEEGANILLYQLASRLEETGRTRSAGQVLKAALDVRDPVWQSYCLMAGMHARAGQWQEALSLSRDAVNRFSDKAPIYTGYVFALGKLGQAEPIIQLVRERPDLLHESEMLFQNVIGMLNELKRSDEAARLIEQYQKSAELPDRALNNVISCYLKVGDLDKARRFADLAARRSRDPAIYHTLACVHALSKEPDRAMEEVRKAKLARYGGFEKMQDDPDLASLHSRPDFKALFGKKKGAHDRA